MVCVTENIKSPGLECASVGLPVFICEPPRCAGRPETIRCLGTELGQACPHSLRVVMETGTLASPGDLGCCWDADRKVALTFQRDEHRERGRMRCSGGREEECWVVLGGLGEGNPGSLPRGGGI